jgi:hypothetical protein
VASPTKQPKSSEGSSRWPLKECRVSCAVEPAENFLRVIGKIMGVKRPLFFESQATILKDTEKLAKIKPDFHVRRNAGEYRVYVAEDKRGEHLIATQKLNLLSDYISKLSSDKAEQISSTALYNALNMNAGAGVTGGYSKYRWRVRAYPIDEAAKVFELNRPSFQTATVLGSKNSLQTTCV